MALLGDFLQDSQVSFLDKPACGAGVLIGVNITSLQSVIPLSMFGIALEWTEGGPLLSFDCCSPPWYNLFSLPSLSTAVKVKDSSLIFTKKIQSTQLPKLHLQAIENLISKLICSVLF